MLTKETQFKEELNDKLGELRRISVGVTFGVATSLPKRSVVEILRDLLNEQKKKTREGQKKTLEQKKKDSELTPNETKELNGTNRDQRTTGPNRDTETTEMNHGMH